MGLLNLLRPPSKVRAQAPSVTPEPALVNHAADRPADTAQSWALLYGIVNTHVERLKKLLAERLDLESVPDPDWTDRAAMDLSREFERHRRYQSAKTRELLRTIEAFCKLRKAAPEGGLGTGGIPMTEDTCQTAEGEEQAAEEYDERVTGSPTAVEKAPNEANLKTAEVADCQMVAAEKAITAGRERSQFARSVNGLQNGDVGRIRRIGAAGDDRAPASNAADPGLPGAVTPKEPGRTT